MPIEVLFRGNGKEVSMGEIAPGKSGAFSDFSEEPPTIISAICAALPEKMGAVYRIPSNTQSSSALTLIPASEYSDDRVVGKLETEGDEYEKEIVNKRGQRVTLVLKLK